MRTQFLRGLWLCATPLILALGCDSLSEGRVGEMAASLQRPDGSDFASLGPDEGTRIYYQFIDERNRVRFVERLEDVPERWRVNAGFVEMSSPPPLTPADARATVTRRAESTHKKRGTDAPRVLLYYADWCGYCRKAKAHLDRRGVPYEIRNVDVSAVKDELLAKTGRSGIPVLDIDGRILQGYRGESLDEMLDTVGL